MLCAYSSASLALGQEHLRQGRAANGLELSRSADAGNATNSLASTGDQFKPPADSAGWACEPLNSPRRRAHGADLPARPPSRPKVLAGVQGFSELLGSTQADLGLNVPSVSSE